MILSDSHLISAHLLGDFGVEDVIFPDSLCLLFAPPPPSIWRWTYTEHFIFVLFLFSQMQFFGSVSVNGPLDMERLNERGILQQPN